jgi:hypothetical protein
LIPSKISGGISNGSLKSFGMLHRSLREARMILAVREDVCLKNEWWSCKRLGFIFSANVQAMATPLVETSVEHGIEVEERKASKTEGLVGVAIRALSASCVIWICAMKRLK